MKEKFFFVLGVLSLVFSVADVNISGFVGMMCQLAWSCICFAMFLACMLKVKLLKEVKK